MWKNMSEKTNCFFQTFCFMKQSEQQSTGHVSQHKRTKRPSARTMLVRVHASHPRGRSCLRSLDRPVLPSHTKCQLSVGLMEWCTKWLQSFWQSKVIGHTDVMMQVTGEVILDWQWNAVEASNVMWCFEPSVRWTCCPQPWTSTLPKETYFLPKKHHFLFSSTSWVLVQVRAICVAVLINDYQGGTTFIEISVKESGHIH